MRIVLDSDLIIAGLISSKGAGQELLKKFPKKKIKVFSSKKQIEETKRVLKRPRFTWKPNKKLWQAWQKKVNLIKLSNSDLKKSQTYVYDPNDSHILSLATKSKANFLLTYNLKDYKRSKIKDQYNVLVVSPGYFLQYLRSINI